MASTQARLGSARLVALWIVGFILVNALRAVRLLLAGIGLLLLSRTVGFAWLLLAGLAGRLRLILFLLAWVAGLVLR